MFVFSNAQFQRSNYRHQSRILGLTTSKSSCSIICSAKPRKSVCYRLLTGAWAFTLTIFILLFDYNLSFDLNDFINLINDKFYIFHKSSWTKFLRRRLIFYFKNLFRRLLGWLRFLVPFCKKFRVILSGWRVKMGIKSLSLVRYFMVHPQIWSFSSALLADIGGSLGLVLGLRKISLFNFSKGIYNWK